MGLPGWQGALEIAVGDLSFGAAIVLEAWLKQAGRNLRFDDVVLFRLVRRLSEGHPLRESWVRTLLPLAIERRDASLVESLLLVLGKRSFDFPELLPAAVELSRSYGRMERVLLNACGIAVPRAPRAKVTQKRRSWDPSLLTDAPAAPRGMENREESPMAVQFPDEVRQFIESTTWRFAKTYAATWPHEYVVRTPGNAEMILALARHIFEHGVEGRFYSTVRKYHHEAGKVYWSMDSTAEATDLINRCDETQTFEARVAAGTLPRQRQRQ